MKALIDKLEDKKALSLEEFALLLSGFTEETSNYLFEKARNIAQKQFKNKIYTRGLI
jgi:biotin synthase